MRILVVNKFYWEKGGSERVLFDLAAGYEAAGHEVVPFSMASARNRATPWADRFVPEVDWESGGPLGALRAAARVIHSGEARRRLAGLLRDARPDVAHLHNFHHQLSPSVVDALREAGVPAVHTLHDYKVVCPNYLLFRAGAVCERCSGGRFHHAVAGRCVRGSYAASAVAALESSWHRARRTLERGIRVSVAPSRFLAAKIAEMGFRGDVRVVPNGIDAASIEPAGTPGDGFLYAGRLAIEKGVDTLVEAVRGSPGLRLTIAGEGPAGESLRRLAAPAGDRIVFAGTLPRAEVLRLARGARAVVMPSVWYENAPLAALEACAAGVPVVASDHGGLPEIVRDGETGVTVPAGSPDALAKALRALQDAPDLAHRLGRRGRAVVEQEYRLPDQVARMLALLEEVASSGSR